LSEAGAKVLYDASSRPGYEEAKKKHLRAVTLIMVQGMVGTPLVFLLVWVMLEIIVYSGIDAVLLGSIFIVLIVLEEILMYRVVRPMLLRNWKSPSKITEAGVEYSGKLIPFRDIDKLTRHDFYLMLEVPKRGAKIPMMNAHLGDADEFIKVFRQQAPGIEFKDMR